MFELPEETNDWGNNYWSNLNDPGGLVRSWRLRELNEEEEYLRNELLHCPPYMMEHIWKQIDDIERRKENIERSFY